MQLRPQTGRKNNSPKNRQNSLLLSIRQQCFFLYCRKKTVIFSHFFFRWEEKKIFKFQKKTVLKHYSVGICGCEHGCGTTHLTIALANYCASKLRQRTACLELNSTANFQNLTGFESEHAPLFQKESQNKICIYGVDYYPNLSPCEIPKIYNQDYHYLLSDFGILTEQTFGEFLRCDQKIIIGSLAPWKQEIYGKFFELYFSNQKQQENFCYLSLFGEKQDMHRFSRKYHISMRQIPFLKNPFHIEKEQFSFLQQLL